MCPSLLLCLSCNGSRSQTAGVPQNNIYPLKNLAMRFLVRFPNPLPNVPRGAQCLRRGTFSLIFNSFKNVYFQLVRLIEGILHIVWAEKTFLLIFRVSCCYFNFWMPKKSQNSTFFFEIFQYTLLMIFDQNIDSFVQKKA